MKNGLFVKFESESFEEAIKEHHGYDYRDCKHAFTEVKNYLNEGQEFEMFRVENNEVSWHERYKVTKDGADLVKKIKEPRDG